MNCCWIASCRIPHCLSFPLPQFGYVFPPAATATGGEAGGIGGEAEGRPIIYPPVNPTNRTYSGLRPYFTQPGNKVDILIDLAL